MDSIRPLGTHCPRVPDQLGQSLSFKDIHLPNYLESLAYIFSCGAHILTCPNPVYLCVCEALRTQVWVGSSPVLVTFGHSHGHNRT